MQRKNSILRSSKRSGFAMIMAIIVIVVLTTIMALTLSLCTFGKERGGIHSACHIRA